MYLTRDIPVVCTPSTQVWSAWEDAVGWSTECLANLLRGGLGLRHLQLFGRECLRLCFLADQVLQERYWFRFSFCPSSFQIFVLS